MRFPWHSAALRLFMALLAAVVLPAAVALLRPVAAKAEEPPASAAQRIVSIGGSVTEIVFALGQEHRLVARDTTSNYPEEATLLPDIGYIRTLSAEGVLSVKPDLILSEAGAGPAEAVDLLKQAGIPFVTIPEGFDEAAILAKIDAVGKALGVPEAARTLHDKVRQDLDTAEAEVGHSDLKVMFILSDQAGRVMAAGSDTAPDGIIRMAGARNAFPDFTGYKILSDEAITAAQPDVILMMSGAGKDHDVTAAELAQNPALATTPAVRNNAVVTMDGMYMLGFSPRTADAVRDLAAALRRVTAPADGAAAAANAAATGTSPTAGQSADQGAAVSAGVAGRNAGTVPGGAAAASSDIMGN